MLLKQYPCTGFYRKTKMRKLSLCFLFSFFSHLFGFSTLSCLSPIFSFSNIVELFHNKHFAFCNAQCNLNFEPQRFAFPFFLFFQSIFFVSKIKLRKYTMPTINFCSFCSLLPLFLEMPWIFLAQQYNENENEIRTNSVHLFSFTVQKKAKNFIFIFL